MKAKALRLLCGLGLSFMGLFLFLGWEDGVSLFMLMVGVVLISLEFRS